MKIMVTGGAGFIGSHLVDKLVEKHEVVVLDNLSAGRKKWINTEARLVEADLKNKDDIRKSVIGCDLVFHLAANPDVALGAKDTSIHLEENVKATHNLLEVMREKGVKELVFTSTSTVYGIAGEIVSEDYGPLCPISLYGASKLACEALISAYTEFGIKAWSFRLANIVGARSEHGVIHDFIKKMQEDGSELTVLGNGEQEKSYMHVKDCVDSILHVYNNTKQEEKSFHIYNVGSEDTIKVKEIAKLIRDRINPEAKIVYTGGKKGWKGDVPKFQLDISKLKSIGFVPQYNSKESVLRVVQKKI